MTGADEAVRALYAAPPDGFVAARAAVVAEARAAGDREAAKRFAALKKPTVAAWVVNLVALRRSDLLDELADIATALRAAQRDLQGDQMRELSLHRRRFVTSLVEAARRLAVDAGAASAKLPLAEVEATFTAALAEPEIAEQIRTGRLIRAVSYAGFGEVPRPRLRLVTDDDTPAPDESSTTAPGASTSAFTPTAASAPAPVAASAPAPVAGYAPAVAPAVASGGKREPEGESVVASAGKRKSGGEDAATSGGRRESGGEDAATSGGRRESGGEERRRGEEAVAEEGRRGEEAAAEQGRRREKAAAEQRRRRGLERAMAAAEDDEKRADLRLRRAEEAERDARHRVEDLEAEIAELERRRAEATADVARRREARRTAEREAAGARRAVGDAQAALDDLTGLH